MPDRGEGERCCCCNASEWIRCPEFADLLPLEDKLVAQSRGDRCIPNPSKWNRVHPEASLIVLLRRPSLLGLAAFAGTPRWPLRRRHSVWRGGEKPPNSLNSRIFYALSILSCGSSVSTARPGRNDCNSASPKRSRSGVANSGEPSRAGPPARSCPRRARKYFSIAGRRAAQEVPPSDANLRPTCRLVDSFVGRPAIPVGANLSASFCGIRLKGPTGFPDWAIRALLLRVWK